MKLFGKTFLLLFAFYFILFQSSVFTTKYVYNHFDGHEANNASRTSISQCSSIVLAKLLRSCRKNSPIVNDFFTFGCDLQWGWHSWPSRPFASLMIISFMCLPLALLFQLFLPLSSLGIQSQSSKSEYSWLTSRCCVVLF